MPRVVCLFDPSRPVSQRAQAGYARFHCFWPFGFGLVPHPASRQGPLFDTGGSTAHAPGGITLGDVRSSTLIE